MTSEGQPNILLIVLDSVRAHNTSLHGYGRETTPSICSLAERSTFYEEARAPSSHSISSHASMFTGYPLSVHCLHRPEQRIDPDMTIWNELSTKDYRTGVFSENPFLTRLSVGLRAPFDTVYAGRNARLPFPSAIDPSEYVHSPSSGRDYGQFLGDAIAEGTPIRSVLNGVGLLSENSRYANLVPDRLQPGKLTGKTFAEKFIEWSQRESDPWAACLNLMDAHFPYLPLEQHNLWGDSSDIEFMESMDYSVWEYYTDERDWSEMGRLENLYDGGIHQCDRAVGKIIEELENNGELSDTLVVVTSDHGQGFGEDCELRQIKSRSHGSPGGLGEGILHVPLLVHFPGQRDSEHVTDICSISEFPTLVREVVADDWSHHSLVTDSPVVALMPARNPGESVGEKYLDDMGPFDKTGKVVYEMENGNIMKYRTSGDDEGAFKATGTLSVERVSNNAKEHVDAVFSELGEQFDLSANSESISEETREHLEDLGYA